MKKIVSAVLVSLVFAMPCAFAHTPAPVDPAAAAAVEELLVSMNYRQLMQQAMQQMQQNMPAMMMQGVSTAVNNDPKLTPEEKKAKLAKVELEIPKMVAAFAATFNDPKLFDEMMAEIVPLYARHFTASEINQMAAFYKTPVGSKMLTTMPQIMSESMMISQRIVMPRVRAAMQKVLESK